VMRAVVVLIPDNDTPARSVSHDLIHADINGRAARAEYHSPFRVAAHNGAVNKSPATRANMSSDAFIPTPCAEVSASQAGAVMNNLRLV